MAPRSSTRASARPSSRREASSPPKHSGDHQSHSHVGRRTRSTRSQSIDVDGGDIEVHASKEVARSRRLVSVESEEDGLDDSANKPSWPNNQQSRKTLAAEPSPDLSAINEDVENGQEVDEDRDRIEIQLGTELSQSPGGASQASQLSGTTAITTHSEDEVRKLNPVMVEFLPELLASSTTILDLLAPPGASMEVIKSIERELKIVGSRRAVRLNHDEKKFEADRENYGKEVDYINPSFIHRALFGNGHVDMDRFRLDPILHAANLAKVVRDTFVSPRGGQNTLDKLLRLDTIFPEVFLGEFDDTAEFGNSRLLDETFDLALDIRTQSAITSLFAKRESDGWDPEKMVLSLFFTPLPDRQTSLQISYFHYVLDNSQVLNIMRAGPENSEDQEEKIISRVEQILTAFQSTDDGDLVDFEQLDDMFPWTGFLTQLALWCRMRLDEIKEDIDKEGVSSITKSLIRAVKDKNSQVDLRDPPSPIVSPRESNPPRTIISSSAGGHNFYDAQMLLRLQERKQISIEQQQSQLDPPNDRTEDLTSSSSNRPVHSTTGARIPSKASEAILERGNGSLQSVMDDPELAHRPTQEYASSWDAYNRDKNKENRPVPDNPEATTSGKRSMHHRQDSTRGYNNTSASSRKRRRREESEDGPDEDFQVDSRIPDRGRRSTAIPEHPSPALLTQSVPEMVQHERSHEAEAQIVRRNRGRFAGTPRDSALTTVDDDRPAESEDEDEDDDGISNLPPPSFQVVSAVARYYAAQTYQPQKRTPWSDADTEHLLDQIGVHDIRWSQIYKAGGFEVERDPVALKDKARNLKTMYLKAGLPLPRNFEHVALGKKEIEAVRRVHPEWNE